MQYQIRPIQKADHPAAAQLVRDILMEFGYTGPGYASSDPEMDDLYAAYQPPGCRYWVVINLDTNQLVGCGGFSPLKGHPQEERVCELQKYYLHPTSRGVGLGKLLLQTILREAKALGYQEMYLESLPGFIQAIGLYQKTGFRLLEQCKGNTGHQEKCSVFMSLLL